MISSFESSGLTPKTAVLSFVDVLRNVLYALHGIAVLDVDVAVEYSKEKRIVGNDPSVVDFNAWAHLYCVPSLGGRSSSVMEISVTSAVCLR